MSWEEKLDRIVTAIEKLASKWAPDDVRNPPFSNYTPPSPTLPPVITQPPEVLSGNRYATIGGVLTDELPFNLTSNTGAHVEVRNGARLRIVVPPGDFYVGRKQLDVSHIAPGAPESVSLTLNGIRLQVPFGGGLAKTPAGEDPLFIHGVTYILDVEVLPIGFGCSLQLR